MIRAKPESAPKQVRQSRSPTDQRKEHHPQRTGSFVGQPPLDATSVAPPANAASRPVQQIPRKAPGRSTEIHRHADNATSGPGHRLPHFDTIQKAFPKHDLSNIKAHTDNTAQDSTRKMGAHAFTRANRVAFSTSNPSLHTTLHEVTHSLQQQGGINIPSGVGGMRDRHEIHADAVADAAIRGEKVSHMMAPYEGNRPAAKRHKPSPSLAGRAPQPGSRPAAAAPVQGMFGWFGGQSAAQKRREQEAQREREEAALQLQQETAERHRQINQREDDKKAEALRIKNLQSGTFSAEERKKRARATGTTRAKSNISARAQNIRARKDAARAREVQSDIAREATMRAATNTDNSNHERAGNEQVLDTGSYINEAADLKDAWDDRTGLLEGDPQHAAGYSPGQADASGDGPILTAGAVGDGIEMYGNLKDWQAARTKVTDLKARSTANPTHDHLKSQLQAAEDSKSMAKRRGLNAALGMASAGVEGAFHYAGGVAGTAGAVPGIGFGAELVAAGEEGVRAKDSAQRALKLHRLQSSVKVTHEGSAEKQQTEKREFASLQAAQKRVEQGKAEEDDWSTLSSSLGEDQKGLKDVHKSVSSRAPADINEMHARVERSQAAGSESLSTFEQQLRMRELMAQQQVSDIRGRATIRQGVKAGLAGASAAGHATSAVGSVTGGADLGLTKASGTAVVFAAGTARQGNGLWNRFTDAQRLAHAKNYADSNAGSSSKRGNAWAMRQAAGDIGKLARSNLMRSRRTGETAREYRNKYNMRTLEEQGENIRSLMDSTAPDPTNKYQSSSTLKHTKASAVRDLATRQFRLDAGHLVDFAGGHTTGVDAGNHASTMAKSVLGAMDVGLKTGETYGNDHEGKLNKDARAALIEQAQQRADLRK